MTTTPEFINEELLFGTIEAARQRAETEAYNLVDSGMSDASDLVAGLDKIVSAIEEFQGWHDDNNNDADEALVRWANNPGTFDPRHSADGEVD